MNNTKEEKYIIGKHKAKVKEQKKNPLLPCKCCGAIDLLEDYYFMMDLPDLNNTGKVFKMSCMSEDLCPKCIDMREKKNKKTHGTIKHALSTQ